MICSPLAKLFAFGPLIFDCALACALDADRSDSAQNQLHPIKPASSTELKASEPALAADPSPAATAPATEPPSVRW